MKRTSFMFYEDWRNAIRGLPNDVRLEIYECIEDYALYGEIKDLKPMASVAFNFIKPAIDRDIEKYMSKCEQNRENGQGGGRPKKTQNNPTKPTGFSDNQKTLIMIMIMIMIL